MEGKKVEILFYSSDHLENESESLKKVSFPREAVCSFVGLLGENLSRRTFKNLRAGYAMISLLPVLGVVLTVVQKRIDR